MDFNALLQDEAKKKSMKASPKADMTNQAAAQMISEAGGGNPLADGLAAGVSTGNPYVAVGMGVLSGLQGAAQEKQRKADIDANALQQIAQNEQNTQMRRSAAIQSLAANISNSLLR